MQQVILLDKFQIPIRLLKFKRCITIEQILSETFLSFNVQTQWYSYIMLYATQKFMRVFERFVEQDMMFRLELGEKYGLHWGGLKIC